MSNKKQTALQWLLDEWPILQSQLPQSIINHALQMEQEQIVDAYVNIGFYGDFDYAMAMKEKAYQYYEQTYGGQDESHH